MGALRSRDYDTTDEGRVRAWVRGLVAKKQRMSAAEWADALALGKADAAALFGSDLVDSILK
jgi:hypothetical protein